MMRCRKAFTLAESMLATVVLATAVAGVSTALASSYQNQSVMRERGVMLQAGRSLVEEIACIQFTQPDGNIGGGWGSGNAERTEYDDIFDYENYEDQSPFPSLQFKGETFDPGAGYKRKVTIEKRATSSTSAASIATTNIAVVRVEVTGPSGRKMVFARWVPRMNTER